MSPSVGIDESFRKSKINHVYCGLVAIDSILGKVSRGERAAYGVPGNPNTQLPSCISRCKTPLECINSNRVIFMKLNMILKCSHCAYLPLASLYNTHFSDP